MPKTSKNITNIKCKKMSNSTQVQSSDPVYLQEQLSLARREIHNLRQQLVSLNHIHRKEIESISSKLENFKCLDCRTKPTVSAPSTSRENPRETKFPYIGVISTPFPEKRGTPRQPGICEDLIAKLTLDNNVFTNPGHSLEGLQEFSHMWILFHFHKNESSHVRAKVAPPRLNGVRAGVLATRSPHRPSPIGLSLVKIDRIMDGTIYFSGVDMVDGTPVLDIKPYIPHYDNPGFTNNALHISEDTTSENYNTTPSGDSRSNSLTDNFLNVNLTEASSSPNNTDVTIDSRVMEGAENERNNLILGAPTVDTRYSRTEESFYGRSSSRIGEREAPDGEEEESSGPQAGAVAVTMEPSRPAVTPEGHIRVPSWIDQAPVPRLNVVFKDRALAQLGQLGPEGEEKKNTITNVLKEDPRSVYLRERWGSHCYVFRIAELCVSCKFNDSSQTVTVYQVFQNENQRDTDE